MGFRCTSSFTLVYWTCCLAKITTMSFNFLQLVERTSLNLLSEEVLDSVVSNDVTITSALHSDRLWYKTIWNKFLIFLKVKRVIRIVHVKNTTDTMSKFIKVRQWTLFFGTRCISQGSVISAFEAWVRDANFRPNLTFWTSLNVVNESKLKSASYYAIMHVA